MRKLLFKEYGEPWHRYLYCSLLTLAWAFWFQYLMFGSHTMWPLKAVIFLALVSLSAYSHKRFSRSREATSFKP